MNNIITANMINITKTDSIDNLDSEIKLHILELNIAFAKNRLISKISRDI